MGVAKIFTNGQGKQACKLRRHWCLCGQVLLDDAGTRNYIANVMAMVSFALSCGLNMASFRMDVTQSTADLSLETSSLA